jgi:hypothetical protein
LTSGSEDAVPDLAHERSLKELSLDANATGTEEPDVDDMASPADGGPAAVDEDASAAEEETAAEEEMPAVEAGEDEPMDATTNAEDSPAVEDVDEDAMAPIEKKTRPNYPWVRPPPRKMYPLPGTWRTGPRPLLSRIAWRPLSTQVWPPSMKLRLRWRRT